MSTKTLNQPQLHITNTLTYPGDEFHREKIHETEEVYRNIVENSLDGIIIIQDEKIVFVNSSAVKILGYHSKDELLHYNFLQTVAAASRAILRERFKDSMLNEQVAEELWIKGLTKQGIIIDLEINAKNVYWNGKRALQTSFRDISERKALERELAHWLWEQKTLNEIDRKLNAVVNLPKVLDTISEHAKSITGANFAGVAMIDNTTRKVSWSAAKGNKFPLPIESIRIESAQLQTLHNNQPLIVQSGELSSKQQANELQIIPTEKLVLTIRYPLIVENEVKGLLVVGFRKMHEVTEQDKRFLDSLAAKSSIALANAEMYENLRQHEKELEMLTGERVRAQEDERRRIAREIHDSLGQMLTAIKFNVEILEDSIHFENNDERKRIEDIKNLLTNTMAEAREISYNLMPSVLVDFGFIPALQLLCDQFQKSNNITISFHVKDVNERFEPSLEIGLYRITQEALTNIAKHSHAKIVDIQFVRYKGGIRLTIEDDGKGFQVQSTPFKQNEKHGIGLLSMRERAMSFNGTLLIDSRIGKGTEIIVDVPLNTPEEKL